MGIEPWGFDVDLVHATVKQAKWFIERSLAHSGKPPEEAIRDALDHLDRNWQDIAQRLHENGWRKYAEGKQR